MGGLALPNRPGAEIVKKITFKKGLDFSIKCAYNNKCQGEMRTASAKRATP